MTDPLLSVSLAAAHAPGLIPSPRLRGLADQLALRYLGPVDPRVHSDHDYLLFQSPAGLALQRTGKGAPGPIMADFLGGKADFRRKHGGGRGQLIARAAGIGKRKASLEVIDATAGLGQDGFVLATLGARVTLLERSPLIAGILADGLDRLAAFPKLDDESHDELHKELRELSSRMHLHQADARQWLLDQTGPAADVIHLDPMFPHRDKTARVKKEMSAFQSIIGIDSDSSELLQAALCKARFRVIVKRPRKAPPIAGPAPDLKLEGRSTRYDVYIIAAIAEPPSHT